MANWDKAGYGGTIKKSGGGKIQPVTTSGDRGWAGPKPGNSSVSRSKGIDTPTTEGNKGINKGSAPTSKAPKD